MDDSKYYAMAVEEARAGRDEGGMPIGCVVVSKDGKVLGRGRNLRVQKGLPIYHAETVAMENTGLLPPEAYKGCTLYTTLSPCDMCAGACLWYGVAKVVIGDNKTARSEGEPYLQSRGVEVVVLDDKETRGWMEEFIAAQPQLWKEGGKIERE